MRTALLAVLLGSIAACLPLRSVRAREPGDGPAARTPSPAPDPGAAGAEDAAPAKKKKPWYDLLTVSGDLRYRYELIDEEDRDPRHRNRVRARIGLEAEPEDWMRLGFRLASGSGDPVSTNQTLGDAFSSKNLRLDKAFAELRPGLLPGLDLRLAGGKMSNPFHRPQKSSLLWDGDLTLEGGAVRVEAEPAPLTLFAVAGAFWVLEHKAAPDPALWALQAGATFALDADTRLTMGAGLFHYSHLRGAEVLVEGDDAFGNAATADAAGVLRYDTHFRLAEGFLELCMKMEEMDVRLFADVVANTGTSSDRMGWLVGASVKGFGFTLAYDYREIEKNAVVGAFTDSDFAGGGTDGRGHRFSAKYGLSKKASLGLTYFLDEKGLEDGTAYHRLQADLALKF